MKTEAQNNNWEHLLKLKADGLQPSDAQWNELSAEEKELINGLEEDGLLTAAAGLLNRTETEQAWNKLRFEIEPVKVKLYPKLLKYAAAVLLPLFLLGGLYVWNKSHNDNRVIDTEDFASITATNHKRATLVLSNGTELNLNHSDSKLTEVEGAHVKNVDSASLQYVANAGKGQNSAADFNELRVPRGAEYKLILADGSQIWVNAASRLRFPVNFNGASTREVYLEAGEAYFQIAKNAKVPFIVHYSKMKVQVLGTSFNINTYTKKIRTTLVEGHVQLKQGDQIVDLLPNQQALVDQQSGSVNKAEVDIEPFVAWKDGWMYFENNTLEEVMEQVGRWYDFDVVFKSEDLKDIHFGGKLKKYNQIGDLLSIIEKTGSVDINLRNHTIYVNKTPN
ncbi:FecR domain-containing protein [Pedobacter sp. MC2016-14]|uniref:FecR family protein n=1 Tax=Pedobacter sp. MC2016-14 TaxID=2897327 RepID=UPI001E4532B1|nr:FecR family protein [Pedobacter sp. MC2016-14]MCD0488604.1 FecR domain-containing protein [Pedobacter sp. MC2016-14]